MGFDQFIFGMRFVRLSDPRYAFLTKERPPELRDTRALPIVTRVLFYAVGRIHKPLVVRLRRLYVAEGGSFDAFGALTAWTIAEVQFMDAAVRTLRAELLLEGRDGTVRAQRLWHWWRHYAGV